MPLHGAAAGTLAPMSESPEPSGDDAIRQLRAELRSHTRVLNALRETQVEQGRALADLRVEMRAGFATLATGMADITRLLRPGTDD